MQRHLHHRHIGSGESDLERDEHPVVVATLGVDRRGQTGSADQLGALFGSHGAPGAGQVRR